MKVVAIVQARMGSSRLPGKVMLDLAGETVLGRCIRRLQRASTLDAVVVATTTNEMDQAIVDYCAKKKWPVIRGSESDVLARYFQAASQHEADVVVRVTSDCPIIEPMLVDQVVNTFMEQAPRVDYVANTLPPRNFPRGLDTEVFSFESLTRAHQSATGSAEREHVTPYIWQNPTEFRLDRIGYEENLSAMRWTVDTLEDYELIRRIYHHIGHDEFSWQDVLHLLHEYPEWLALNQTIQQKVI